MLNITKADIREAERVMTVVDAAYDALENLEKNNFMAAVGTIIDRWAVQKGLTPEETYEILDTLATFQKMVWQAVGNYGVEKKENAPEGQE